VKDLGLHHRIERGVHAKKGKGVFIVKEGKCYESPKKETVSYIFKHLIQNLKSYNEVKV